jgi:hypothetical protein
MRLNHRGIRKEGGWRRCVNGSKRSATAAPRPDLGAIWGGARSEERVGEDHGPLPRLARDAPAHKALVGGGEAAGARVEGERGGGRAPPLEDQRQRGRESAHKVHGARWGSAQRETSGGRTGPPRARARARAEGSCAGRGGFVRTAAAPAAGARPPSAPRVPPPPVRPRRRPWSPFRRSRGRGPRRRPSSGAQGGARAHAPRARPQSTPESRARTGTFSRENIDEVFRRVSRPLF